MSWQPHKPDRWEVNAALWLIGFIIGLTLSVLFWLVIP